MNAPSRKISACRPCSRARIFQFDLQVHTIPFLFLNNCTLHMHTLQMPCQTTRRRKPLFTEHTLIVLQPFMDTLLMSNQIALPIKPIPALSTLKRLFQDMAVSKMRFKAELPGSTKPISSPAIPAAQPSQAAAPVRNSSASSSPARHSKTNRPRHRSTAMADSSSISSNTETTSSA